MNNIFSLLKDANWENIISIASIVVILIATIVLVKLSRRIIDSRIKKVKTDKTQINFLKHLLAGLIYFLGGIAAVFQVPGLKNAALSILASSGILAVIIGFASQQTFANIVSGLFISIFKPFRIGDRISFLDRNTTGIVEDITLRHTVIKTFENKRIIVPNDIINREMIENASIIDEKSIKYIDFGISYDSNIDKALGIIRNEIIKHPNFIDNRTEEEKAKNLDACPVKVIGFTDSSVSLRGWAWSKDPASAFEMGCDLNKSIKERFDAEGIEIPYPYRTIVIKEKKSDFSISESL